MAPLGLTNSPTTACVRDSRRFRERFVERLQPRHLASGWAVAHQAPREFGPYSIFNQDGPDGEDEEEDATADEPALVSGGREDNDSPSSSMRSGEDGEAFTHDPRDTEPMKDHQGPFPMKLGNK